MGKYSLEDIQPAYNVVLPNVTITNGRNKAVKALNAQLNVKNRNEQAIRQSIAKVPKEKGLEGVYPEFALLSGGKFTGDAIADALGGIAGKAISKAAPYVKRAFNSISNINKYNLKDSIHNALENTITKDLYGDPLNTIENTILKVLNIKGTKQSIPAQIKTRINNEVTPRLQQQRQWIKATDLQRQVDKILDEGYTSYSDKVFKSQGIKSEGFHILDNGHIAINRDVASPSVLEHEIRHKIDNAIPLTEEEERILNIAYGDDFIRASKSHKDLKNYANIEKDMVTTNRDARAELLRNNKNLRTIDQQNEYIDKAGKYDIIDAITWSNGYGSNYIDYLIDNNLLTEAKIKAFKEAMKNVGGVIPFGIGLGATKFNNNNSK